MNRRTILAFAAAAFVAPFSARVLAAHGPIDVKAILNDPDAPVGGNPGGDVTIVAFLDYNCPFCKKVTPALAKLVAADGGVRLVYKDWPILAASSVDGARMALAAKYQGKYEQAHAALMAVPGRNRRERMAEAIRNAGVDMTRLEADLKTHDSEISALINRNRDEADSLGLEGTPVFLIGPFKVAAALDYDGLKRVVDQARTRQNGAPPAQ
jgi:protein-disulfide isomerase